MGDSLARGPKLLSIKSCVIEIITWKFVHTHRQRWKTAWTLPPAIYWSRPVTCICLCSAFPHLGNCESNAAWVKMYTVEQRVFLFRKYWQTGSRKACQTAFRTEFGERRAPSKCCIQKLVKKLETTGSLLTQHAGGRRMSEETIHDVKERLLGSSSKSLRSLSQETNLPYSTWQRSANKAKLRAYRVSCVQELLPMDHEKRVRFCLWVKNFLPQNPGILDQTFLQTTHGFIWAGT